MALKVVENEILTITNEHPIFEGTVYAEAGFTIFAKPPTASAMHALTKRHSRFIRKENREVLDEFALRQDHFDEVVTGWEGIEDNAGPIPCNRETKLRVLDLHPQLANLILAAVITRNISLDPERALGEEAEAKNSGKCGSGA